jgi:hypothetical protein
VAGVAGGLELLGESLPGKKKAIAFPVALLVFGRDRGGEVVSLRRSFLLLLFYRLTFPAACHLGNLTSKSMGGIKKHLACDSGPEYYRLFRKALFREDGVAEPEGVPRTGRMRLVPNSRDQHLLTTRLN